MTDLIIETTQVLAAVFFLTALKIAQTREY